ncbi:glycosyltransferase family A protein [Hyphococcus flavus]|uniref:Glycosyltransferase family A protein n=1 Tax=Hyphococcus flavus TaxID=1866326 RepID=A0AAE9ZCP6_9PROT|nr:glycosyltransferase family A protein [Hyphococcus flavus]WDI32483.1 glycosyltransferase family A protein [Hyphococcus flavus]
MAQVDIVTRTKNRPLFMKRCLADLQKQNFRDFHWIIVNDGGDPKPVEDIVAQAKSAGLDVELLSFTESNGMEAAGNKGARAGNAPFITIHDDDDTWDPRFLSSTFEALKNENYIGAVSWSTECSERVEGEDIVETSRRRSEYCPDAIDLAGLSMRNRFPPIAFLFKRTAYEAAGGFEESLDVLGDWDFNLRMLMLGDFVVIREELARYHIREAGSQNANSVTDQNFRHVQMTANLRNKYIRKDMETGRFGLGSMMASAAMIEDAAARASYSQRFKRLRRQILKQ